MFTVTHLVDSYKAAYATLVSSRLKKPATAAFYAYQLRHLVNAVGGMPADSVRTWHLAGVRFTHHFTRALKAVYKWATEEDLVPKNPFVKLKTPRCGQRTRILSRAELARLYRASPRPFRRLLMLARYTMARPGELRQLRWGQVHLAARLLLLTEFKAKDQRTDGAQVRRIPLARPAGRLLAAMYDRQGRPGPDAFVFLNRRGRPLTGNGVRCSMRKARTVAGLEPADGGERIVTYTLRHTGATEATAAGLRDRKLADIMGHTTTAMTARYQHLDGAELVDGIDQVHAGRRRKPAR